MRQFALTGAMLCAISQAQPPGARIALRLGTDEVLIIDHELSGKIPDFSGPKAAGGSPLQPIEEIFRLPKSGAAGSKEAPGEHWLLYTGAGPSIPIVIDSPAAGAYCGGLGGYAAALARFERPEDADRVAGLRSGEYLAAPGTPAIGPVSTQPLEPVDTLREHKLSNAVGLLMAQRERKFEASDDWAQGLRYDDHLMRWRVPGHRPLLFVEAVWADGKGNAVTGATAVVEEVDPKIGELMRVPEIIGIGGWKRPDSGIFLNAWAVEGRRFVLQLFHGYEGFEVELKELVPGKGLAPTSLHFGAGC